MRALAAATDAAIADLWAEAGEPGAALAAVGGYGRGELSPRSDIDLLILYRRRRAPEAAARRLLYELWDAGLEVGHATRTIKESLRIASQDVDAEMALLDARLLAGDAALFEEFRAVYDARILKEGRRFAARLAGAVAVRHAAHGEVPFLLEPNLKEGAGGLRDLAAARWLARAFPGEVTPPDLEAEAEILHRIRNWLHHHTGRRTDTLLLPYQDPAARDLGYAGERPGDALMRDFYGAARGIWWAARATTAAVLPPVPRGEAEDLPTRIRRLAPPPGPAWPPELRRDFFEVLRSGSADSLEELDRSSALTDLIPEWADVRCLPQRNVYHRYTVDVHGFFTVAEMVGLGGGEVSEEDRLAAEVWRDVADRDRALLAALLHDVGKGGDEDHQLRGERVAQAVGERIGLAEGASEVAWLVRNHLLLAEAATRRDTRDQRLVESVAANVSSVERLKMLYVLTVADARATGPEAWTPWKAALVAELFTKALHVLERGEVVGRDADATLKLRTAEVREALASRPPGEVDAHLLGMTRGYILAFPTEALVRHFAVMATPPEPGEVRLHAVPAGERGVWEVTMVARDRPGLFALMSGALALAGINILSAQVFTRADGLALEVFRVVGAFDPEFPPERWERVRADAAGALGGELDLERELAAKRRTYARESRGKREPARVVVDTYASDFATVIEVHAADRIGLLYAITSAIADAGLTIDVAKVATYGDDVIDSFYVRDLEGQKVADPERISAISSAVLARVEAS